MFWELVHFDFSNMDVIFSSMLETVSIAVLSLLYSLILGGIVRNVRGQKHFSGLRGFQF